MSDDADGTEEPWELVVADMHATADAYRERGWDTVELLPDLVGVLDPEAAPERQGGFDLVVSEEAFADLLDTVEGHEFDSFELLRAEAEDVVYVVTAIEDREAELAVLLAVTYETAARETLESLVDAGTVYVHVRREMADRDDRVTFTLEEPEGLVPEEA
jgi:hypothetical protein